MKHEDCARENHHVAAFEETRCDSCISAPLLRSYQKSVRPEIQPVLGARMSWQHKKAYQKRQKRTIVMLVFADDAPFPEILSCGVLRGRRHMVWELALGIT